MNAALGLLIALQLRGWVRYLVRNLLTLKGALLGTLGGTFFVLWLLSVVTANSTHGGLEPRIVLHSGPGVLLLYCLINVMMSSSERGIYFTPAEINFLFPAPTSRRSLLAYRIVSSQIVGLPSSLIVSIITYGFSASFLTAFVGIVMLVLFMQLFPMAIKLIAVTVGTTFYSRSRKLLAVALLLLAALTMVEVGGNPMQRDTAHWLRAAGETATWQTITLPLTWFFKTLEAKEFWPDLVRYASLSLLVNGVLLGVVFALDAQYMEAAAFASARIYARMQRIRTGSGGAAPPSRLRFALPMPLSLGGVGPICWRQLTTSFRMPVRLLYLAFVFFVAILASQAMNHPHVAPASLAVMAGFAVIGVAVLLTPMLPFDFRGDVDRMALLKTLPLPAWRLALGQVLAPVLLFSTMQWLVLSAFYLWIVQESANRGPWPWLPGAVLLAFAFFAPPVNMLLFAVENLLFLLFPTRILANNPADFQAIGRNAIFLLAKMFVLGSVFLLAGMVGYLVGMFYPLLGLILAWVLIVLLTAPLIPLIGWAFSIFDVSRDTPA